MNTDRIQSAAAQSSRREIRQWRRRSGWLAALLLVMLAVAAPQRAFAQTATPVPKPLLSLDKSIGNSITEVEIGEEFEYLLAVSCTSVSTDCLDATIVDVLPGSLEYVDYVGTDNVDSVSVSGQTVTIFFISPLPAGSTDIVRLLVRFRGDTIPGEVVINEATFDASNADAVTDQAPVITATGGFTVTVDKSIKSEPVVGQPITFELKMCIPATGSVPLFNPVLVDTLPPGATFVSAGPGSTPTDWVYAAGPPQTVTFTDLPNPILAGSCVTRQVTVIYDTLPLPNPTTQTNSMELTGTPAGCEVANNLQPYCNGSTTISEGDSVDFTLVEPFARAEGDKRADANSSFNGTEALPGELVTYSLRIRNTGFLTYTNMVVTETIPAALVFQSVTFSPAYTPPITSTYSTALLPNLFINVPGSPFAIATTVVSPTLAGTVSAFRWQLGPVPPGIEWVATVVGRVADDAVPPLSFENCMDWSGEIEGVVVSSGRDCASTSVINERSIPRITKDLLTAGEALPGDTLTYRIRTYNASQAHLNVINPVITDLLPAQFDLVPGSFIVESKPAGAPDPLLEAIDNFNGTGRTLLRATWIYDFLPGEEAKYTFSVVVVEGTPPSTIVNNANLSGFADTNPLACTGDDLFTDTDDLNGNGSDPVDSGCTSDAPAVIGVQLSAETQKYTRSLFSPEWGEYSYTQPGGTVEYRLSFTNTSNVSITNIALLDIFPFVNDKGVIDTSPRNSAWTTNLISKIQGPPGVPLTVLYSNSNNPCRPEFVPAGPSGCEAPAWSLDFPENPITFLPDPTLVNSAYLILCDVGPAPGFVRSNCYDLPRNANFALEWLMTAPANAPFDGSCGTNPPGAACPVAWNSFAFAAEGGGVRFQPTEPPKVGVGIQDPTRILLGDFVWLDIAGIQGDGIQQPEEEGINNVRVVAQDTFGNTLAGVTVTGFDAQVPPRPGYYLFTNLVRSRYNVTFAIPPGAIVSPPRVGTDQSIDSNGTITNSAGLTVSTGNFIANIDNLTIDQGFWYPTDYGDAPYDGVNFFYPTRALSLTNPSEAARHVIGRIRLGGLVDDELDGVPSLVARGDDFADSGTGRYPGTRDEDGVTFPGIKRTVAGPGGPELVDEGVLEAGASTPITIALSMPPTITAYTSVWIDFNADGDWDDSGEQVVTDLPQTGNGTLKPSIAVPASAITGTTYVRVRTSEKAGYGVRGTALDGEVEDYRIQIIGPPQKTIFRTFEAHTTGYNMAIGELVVYQIRAQIPEGRLENFLVVDNIPDGMVYMEQGRTFFETSSGISSTTTVQIGGAPFGPGSDITYDFGTIINQDDDRDGEFAIIEMVVLMANTNDGANNNQAGVERINTAKVYYGTATTQVAAPAVRVVEPVISIAKTVLGPAPSDAGDRIVYQIVATHTAGNDRATAFDGVISDTIDSNVTLAEVSATAAAGVLLTNTSTILANQVQIDFGKLEVGQSVTIVVTGTVKDNVPVSLVIPNRARVTWTSLPNAKGSIPFILGDPGSQKGERTGQDGLLDSGVLNDYRADAQVNTPLSSAPQIFKVQPPPNYTIGSVFTYTLVITTPEGILDDVAVTDQLPPGLRLLGQRVITTAAESGGLLAADYAATLPPPTVNVVGTSGAAVTWTFGAVQNPGDNILNNNRFLILLQVVVENVIANQDGVALVNSAALRYLNPNTSLSATIAATPVTVNLLEPKLDILKTATTVAAAPDAGDVVTYVVTFQHAADSHWPAYNVLMVDTIPNLILNPVQSGISATGIGVPGASIGGGSLRIPDSGTIPVMPIGASVTITYVGTLDDAVQPNTTITNTAGAIWASLPPDSTERRWDGLGTPNGQDLITSNALNNYEANAQAQIVTSGSVAISKALEGTSAVHTPGSDVTIGEVVTYSLRITLSEESYTSLQVVDDLPAGLAYVGGSATVDSTGFVGTLPAPTIAPAGDGISGGDVTFSFGPTVVSGDNQTATNAFTLRLRARVLDIPANVGLPPNQSVLTNGASLSVNGGTPLPSNLIDVTVVEPQMVIRKTIDPRRVRPSDLVTVTLVISNVGTSTGFEVEMSDPLPPEMTYDSGFVEVSGNGLASAVLTPAPSLMSADWAAFPAGTSSTLRFQARMGSNLLPFKTIRNAATVQNATTLPGVDPGERTEPPDDSSALVITIIPSVSVTKSVDSDSFEAGQVLVYQIRVTNSPRFPIRATGVVITETVSTATNFVAAQSTPGWLNAQGTAPCADGSPAGTVCIFPVGDMAIAEIKSVLFAVRVVSPLPEPAPAIANLLCVDNDATNGDDPIPEDNCGSVITPFGLAQVGDYVWEDLNRNGIQEAGEPPVAGVEVRLFAVLVQPFAAGATASMTTTTDASGLYYFTNLEPGPYRLQFVLPNGYFFTLPGQGQDRTLDSDASPSDGATSPFTLLDGMVDNQWDAGLVRPAALGDRAWVDTNANGQQDAGEAGLPGVVVTLIPQIVQPFVAGAALPLTQTTDASGSYLFAGLLPGSYALQFAPPLLWLPTLLNVGNDDTIDSDIDPATLRTSPVTLQSNETNRTIDGGFYRLGALGRYVWLDDNKDGVRQDSEALKADVIVRLYRSDGAGPRALHATTLTNADGHFEFLDLTPGVYVIEVVPPPGYLFTTQNVATEPGRNSDVDVATGRTPLITLGEGVTDNSWGAGLVVPALDQPSLEPDGSLPSIYLPTVIKQ